MEQKTSMKSQLTSADNQPSICRTEGINDEGLEGTIPYAPNFKSHIVLRDDTLAGLSLRYNVPAVEIQRANGLFSKDIWHRDELRIPVSAIPLDGNGMSNQNYTRFDHLQDAAAEAQLRKALCLESGVESATARSVLARLGNQDFDAALKVCKGITTAVTMSGKSEDSILHSFLDHEVPREHSTLITTLLPSVADQCKDDRTMTMTNKKTN